MEYTPTEIPGWMEDGALYWLYETAKTMNSIVEIGSWMGRSTHALCSGCPGTVIAVDHFKGNPNEIKYMKAELDKGVKKEFEKNVGHFKNLKLMEMESREAAGQIPNLSVDMVFIDGCHIKEDVMSDLLNWLPKFKKMICGHDLHYDGVMSALLDMKIPFMSIPGTFLWAYSGKESNGQN